MDNSNTNINESLTKINFYSTNNLFFSLFYSGCGIPYFFSDKEINHLNEICREDDKEFLENLMPLRCVYKKAKPIFSEAPHEIINPGKYVWDFDSFVKEINVTTQAFSVLSMLYMLNSSMEHSKLFDYVVLKQIKNFVDFITGFLRNKDGLFIDAEDKTKYLNDELKIKQEKEADVLSQFYIFEMLLAYAKYLKENNLQSEFYKNEANVLFKFIFENFNSILDLTTRDISLISSSLYRSSSFAADESMYTSISELIALSCAEIESRIKINGEVEKSSNNFAPSSIITHFRAASSLIEGYLLTKIEKFKDAANRILGYLLDLWNENVGLFMISQGEYKYSIRDISEVIKCLILYNQLSDDDSILGVLNRFIDSAIEESGIVQSITRRSFVIDGIEVNLGENIPLYNEIGSAPVYLRSFNYSNLRLEKYETSNFANLYYSIYASFIMLNAISSFKEKNRPEEVESTMIDEILNDEEEKNQSFDFEIPVEIKESESGDTLVDNEE